MAFTKIQLEFIHKMLDDYSYVLSNNSCNDYQVPVTPENIEFCVDVELVTGDPEYPEDLNISSDGEEIYLMDYQIVDYLKHIVKQELDKNRN